MFPELLEATLQHSNRPAGVTALSLFFGFGVLACVSAAALLTLPGTALDAAWRVNPRGHEGFLRMGGWALLLLTAVGAACALSAVGLWRLQNWGRRLATAVLVVNLIGDTANAIVGRDPRSWIGVPIAAALIAYLSSRRVAGVFGGEGSNSPSSGDDRSL